MDRTQDSLQFQRTTPQLVSLRRRWWAVAFIYTISLGWGYMALPAGWHQQGFAQRWALTAALVAGYLLWRFYRSLPDNHRRDETTVLPTLGLGNSLTLLRGLAIGPLAGFLLLPRPAGDLFAWVPALLYTWIIVLDFLDGYAARVTNHATGLGETLDAVYDEAAFLTAVSLVVWYGLLPVWYLPVGLVPYLFRLGLWRRQKQGQPIFALPVSQRRRLLAGFQMGFLSALLWPLPYPPGTMTLAGVIFVTPLLVGFWRDWLVVSGQVDPASPRYLALHARLSGLLDRWLPPLLRAGVVVLALVYLLPDTLAPGGREALWPWPDRPLPAIAANLLALLSGVTMVLLALGWLARVAALGLLIPTLATIPAAGLDLWSGSLLAGLLLLMLLGGGNWSLWRLDDLWVSVRAGESR